MQFASRQIREALARTGDRSLDSLRITTKQKYQQTLNFMREWTQDLMQRENELQQQRSQSYAPPMHDTNPHKPKEGSGFNIQKLIKEQFFKKVESLYMKQLAMADITESHRQQMGSQHSDSLNHTEQHSNTFDQELSERRLMIGSHGTQL